MATENAMAATTFANDTVSQWMYGELLERSERIAVFDRYAKQVTLPAGWGNTVQFVRYERPGLPSTTLTDGTTPDGQSLTVSKVTAQVDQWGGYFTLTDTAILQTFHGPFEEAVSMSGDQWGQLRDRETIRGLLRATQTYVAAGKTAATLTSNDVPTTTDVLTIVESLRAKGAPTYTDDYICICDTANEADLLRDSTFTSTKQMQDQQPLERGQFLRWMGCTFVRSNQIPSYAYNASVVLGSITTPAATGGETAIPNAGGTEVYHSLVAVDKYGQEFAAGASTVTSGLTTGDVIYATTPALSVQSGTAAFNLYVSAPSGLSGSETLVARGLGGGVSICILGAGTSSGKTAVIYGTTGQLVNIVNTAVKQHYMFFIGQGYFANTKNGSMIPTLTAPTTMNRTTDSDPLGQRRKVGWKGWGKWGVILNQNYGMLGIFASKYTGYVTV